MRQCDVENLFKSSYLFVDFFLPFLSLRWIGSHYSRESCAEKEKKEKNC